ncbi:MAG: dicarboxylate/amino acid:cation symporter [Pseudomonadales bacterium]|nr:dicarboxylate/amino acid:cation symporter [Pseudomonadales bacterium]
MKIALHWQILISIFLAVIAGLFTTEESQLFGVLLMEVYQFFGTLFLSALKMIIVPLIVASIIASIASLGSNNNLGKLGLKTISFYLISSLLAILAGLLVVNITTPGIIDGQPAKDSLTLFVDEAGLENNLEKIDGRGAGDISAIFLRMVPPNIVEAAAQGQMLGLIFFSVLFGLCMTRINGEYQQVLNRFWHGVADTMIEMTWLIMKFAPIGVFALVAKTITITGLAAFKPMLVFFFTVSAALFIHMFITMPVLMRLTGKITIKNHFQAMTPALLTAFSTASSSATLPLTMECAEKRAGISRKTSSFVLPLGATVNMDGTALYECVAAMFIAQAYGLDLSFATQFTVVFVALLTSIGVAGIPAASLVAIAVILGAIGLPLEGIGLLMVTDRILDMMRTAVNVFSDSCAAAVIASSENS